MKTILLTIEWLQILCIAVRKLDDIFGIWLHGEQSLIEFKDHLNSVDKYLKFTLEYSWEKVDFLDTMVHSEKS